MWEKFYQCSPGFLLREVSACNDSRERRRTCNSRDQDAHDKKVFWFVFLEKKECQ
jgi:hypothetical protein